MMSSLIHKRCNLCKPIVTRADKFTTHVNTLSEEERELIKEEGSKKELIAIPPPITLVSVLRCLVLGALCL